MTKTQIRTQRISFILALSVITYTVVDTYLFAYHDIDVMKIMTPVILGLVAAIILCGLLHKFLLEFIRVLTLFRRNKNRFYFRTDMLGKL
jgi:membrane-associated HD superfamily phosphohydrolase